MEHRLLLERLLERWDRRAQLSQQDRKAIVDLAWTHRTLGRAAYLVREGERTTHCNLLISGIAFRQKLASSGARQIISFHFPGEFLDAQNCFLEVADHNVQALTRIGVAVIDKHSVIELMDGRPNVRRALWLDGLIDAAIFREWVVNLGRRNARARIAHLLCEISQRMQEAGMGDGEHFDFPITQEQIADATGLTAVHANRTLQSLRKDGLISMSPKRLAILDRDGLSEAGDFHERYLHHPE